MESITVERNFTFGPEITWPKDFPELKLIDDALRCGICYDYIKTCMVTPCAHSYCSICIRKSLLYKTACPTCFEETFETHLRNNRVLDRIAELYVNMRDKLIKHLRIAALHFNCNEQIQSPLASQNVTSQKTSLSDATPKRNSTQKPMKSSTKGKSNLTLATSSNTTTKSDISRRLEDILGSPASNKPKLIESYNGDLLSTENEVSKFPTVPPMFLQPKMEAQPKPIDVATVECPVCHVHIPERNINTHLDNCLVNSDKEPLKSPVKNRPKRNPLPKMVWSMMAEKELRKKLKDYGLNTQGDKKSLISRLQRYILLFNSECDSDNPRPISEIIRQVEKEEKQVPGPQQQRLVMINKKTDPKIIEEENKKYIQENKESFKKLIEAMKQREGRNIKPLRPLNRISSDDEEGSTKNFEEVSELPSTSKSNVESVNLCDSNDDNSLSPVLGAESIFCNGSDSSEQSDIFLPSVKKNSGKKNKIYNNSTESSSLLSKHVDAEPYSHSANSPETSPLSSPSKLPSPSCIVRCHSDSEDSISLLINQNIENSFAEIASEPHLEEAHNHNSQIDDPDFVIDTEDQIENFTEEVILPRKRSKRKLANVDNPDSGKTPSPRRTRRRLNK